MSGRIAVAVFPGTNSEDETVRLLRDCGGEAELVHWSQRERLSDYDAYVLSGGFAYEDRIRAGAIAAHDRIMDFVIEARAARQAGLRRLQRCANSARSGARARHRRVAAADRGLCEKRS